MPSKSHSATPHGIISKLPATLDLDYPTILKLWRHFRYTDAEVVARYGRPSFEQPQLNAAELSYYAQHFAQRFHNFALTTDQQTLVIILEEGQILIQRQNGASPFSISSQSKDPFAFSATVRAAQRAHQQSFYGLTYLL